MARHAVRAGRPEPKAVIKAAPSEYEKTHPVGSAERFLDQAAKEALAFAAAGGIPPPSRFIPGAVRAVAKKAGEYPDPMLREAAGLPAKELARRAAHAEAYRKAMDAQNAVVDTVSLVTSPMGNMVANQVGAAAHDALARQDWGGGKNSVERVELKRRAAPKQDKALTVDDIYASRLRIGPASSLSVPVPSRQELRDMTAQDVTPTDSAANGFARSGNIPGVLAMGLLKAAETYGVAKTVAQPGNVRLISKRNKIDGSPVASRPIDATPEQRVDFEEAIRARNQAKRQRRSSGSTADQDAQRHMSKAHGRLMSVLGQNRAPEALRRFLQDRPFKQISSDLIEVPVKSDDLAAAREYIGQALDRSESRFKTPWCTVSDETPYSYTKYSAVPHALYVNVRTGKPVAYRASNLFRDASLREGIPLYYDLDDQAHRALADAVDPRASKTREKETPDPHGSIRWAPTSSSDSMLALDMLQEPQDAPYRRTLVELLRDIAPDDPVNLPPPPPEQLMPDVNQDAKGGDARGVHAADEGGDVPATETPAAPQGGPRIVINPQVFNDKRDALCVAFNEAFRVVMEMNGFEPASEPTEAQRKFFADTAYADDELQLRRTILARIATLDTSVKDPTDEQLEETAEMLEMVMEVGAPQSEWEQAAVKRLHDVVVKSLESTRANGTSTPAPQERGSARADLGGGEAEEERKPRHGDIRYVEKDGNYFKQTYRQGDSDATSGRVGTAVRKSEYDAAQSSAQRQGPAQEDGPAPEMTVQDKLRLADERLKSLEGTEKHDMFKARVDEMHRKYDTAETGQPDMTQAAAARPEATRAAADRPEAMRATGGDLVDSLVDKAKSTALTRGVLVGARALQWAETVPANLQLVKTAGMAGAKAVAKDVATDLAGHAFGKMGGSVLAAAQFAAGGVKSAVGQGSALLDAKSELGATWSDVASATKDVFTTARGWRNLGRGLVGSVRDVGNFMTGGWIDNGDRMRRTMEADKGGKTLETRPGKKRPA